MRKSEDQNDANCTTPRTAEGQPHAGGGSSLVADICIEAHRLLDLGYTPLPADPAKKCPPFPWKLYQGTPPSHDDLDQLFAQHPKATGLGIVTNGMVVLDLDPMPDGSPNLFPADPEHVMALSCAPAATTPRGGLHLYFQAPTGITITNSTGKIANHVDVRAAGGFLMVPPTVRGDRQYAWRGGDVLNVSPHQLPELPQFVLDLLQAIAPASRVRPSCVPLEGPIVKGQRNDRLFRLAAKWRGMGLPEADIQTLLERHNSTRCVPPLSRIEIEQIAKSASKYKPNCHVDPTAKFADSGPIPDRLFEVPGYITQVMELTLRTAPRPNRPLALAGAMTLLAMLAGRKVRTETDLRTNLYVIGLGASGVGKDHPRKIAKKILFAVGMDDALIGSIASGQALEDEVLKHHSCLALTDELDELMMAIRQDRSGTRQNLAKTLMELFTSASVPYQTRAKVGQGRQHVDQPNLCLFGTAVPEHFYDSISARMLDDGFLGRALIVEAGPLGPRQLGCAIEIPAEVLATTHDWVRIESDPSWDRDHPEPRMIMPTPDATNVLEQAADDFDDVRRRAQAAGDTTAVSIWARAWEHASKLALLYAISEDARTTQIGLDAAAWAVDFVGHHSRRLIAIVHGRVAENAFHALMIKAKGKLRNAPKRTMSRSQLVKNMHISARDLDQVIGALAEGGEIEVIGGTPGAPDQRGTSYRLVLE